MPVPRILLVLALVFGPGWIVPSAHAQDVDSWTPAEAALAAELKSRVEERAAAERFSGTVLLAKGENVLFEGAYGLASRRYGVAMQIDTKLNIGSMNKMMTGVAICQLVEQGRLSFADPVGKYLPDYPNADVREKVTIHHLLTHTSGLGSYWNEEFEARRAQLRTVVDLIPLFAEDPLRFEPGARFGYSNSGPVLLGRILEVVTGQSYYDYIRKHVTGPAGMKGTDCYETDDPVPNLAMGYMRMGADGRPDPSAPLRSNLFAHSVRGGPAGGGYSTVGDLQRFALAIMNHRLLGEEMTKTLLEGKVELGPGVSYAYLFDDSHLGPVHFYGHNGGGPGINGELTFFPGSGYVLAVLSNIDLAATEIAEEFRPKIAALIDPTAARDRARPPYRLGLRLALSDGEPRVEGVDPGGPAEKAGLLAGDVLVSISSRPVGADVLAQIDDALRPGTPFRIGVRRGSETLTVAVRPERVD
ncbi:MAG: serine hydrolase [Planctomycetota bacterium]